MYSHIKLQSDNDQNTITTIILTYSHQHTFSTAKTSRQVSTAVSCGVLRLTFTTTRPRILPAKIWEAAWCRSTKATYRDETWLDPTSFSTTVKKGSIAVVPRIRKDQKHTILKHSLHKVCLCFWNPSGDIESCQFLAVFTEQSSRFSKGTCETNREALHSLKMFKAMIFGTFWSPKFETLWNTETLVPFHIQRASVRIPCQMAVGTFARSVQTSCRTSSVCLTTRSPERSERVSRVLLWTPAKKMVSDWSFVVPSGYD